MPMTFLGHSIYSSKAALTGIFVFYDIEYIDFENVFPQLYQGLTINRKMLCRSATFVFPQSATLIACILIKFAAITMFGSLYYVSDGQWTIDKLAETLSQYDDINTTQRR